MNADSLKMLINFAGGLGLFIYGMTVMAESLQKAAGNKMKGLLSMLTSNKMLAILVGAGVTAVIQSSSASTVMVVGFVNAGLMELTQAVGVIMGANIGTTITGWIVSSSEWAAFLKPTTIAPLVVAIGVTMMYVPKKQTTKLIGSVLLGFGILFIGMNTMSSAVKPLSSSPTFEQAFVTLGTNPLLGFLVGAGVTMLIQSSSASMGILLSLAAAGLVPFSAAVYIIMGQNVGTCITALLSSMGASKNGKAAAYIHLLFNVIGSVIAIIIATVYFKAFNPTLADSTITLTEITLIHTVFNIANTILMYPFSNQLVRMAEKLAGITAEDKLQKTEVQLDERLFEMPSVAIDKGRSEVIHMAENTLTNLKNSIEALKTKDENLSVDVLNLERTINNEAKMISDFLAKVLKCDLTNRENDYVTLYFQTVTDIERIGDHAENLIEVTKYMIDENLEFSPFAVSELDEMFRLTIQSYEFALKAFKENDKDAAIRCIKAEEEIDILEKQLRANHIQRLTDNLCDTKTGVAFLDILQNLERVSDHANNISSDILKYKGE